MDVLVVFETRLLAHFMRVRTIGGSIQQNITTFNAKKDGAGISRSRSRHINPRLRHLVCQPVIY